MMKDGQETVQHNSAAEFLPPSVLSMQEKINKHRSTFVNLVPLHWAVLSLGLVNNRYNAAQHVLHLLPGTGENVLLLMCVRR